MNDDDELNPDILISLQKLQSGLEKIIENIIPGVDPKIIDLLSVIIDLIEEQIGLSKHYEEFEPSGEDFLFLGKKQEDSWIDELNDWVNQDD